MKKHTSHLILCFAFFTIQLSVAQENLQLTPVNNYNYFSDLWDNFNSTPSSAFTLKEYANWKILTYSAITAHFIFGNDFELHEEYIYEKEYWPAGIPKLLGKIGETYDKPGTIYATLGLAGVLYGSGKLTQNKKIIETTNLMTQSLIISGVFTTMLKAIIGRARPYTNRGPHFYKPFNYKFNANYMSMPSGHTSSAFALMTVIAKQHDSWYVQIPAYTFAVSVAFQRIKANKHWGSDLIIGGTLGYLIGATIVSQSKRNNKKFSLQPIIGRNGIGFAVKF
ncbi:MAG: phosphatase PAP2 family protein [Calditrichaeota bacterium]|nr:MAG: PAP2 family protein [Calditrichota bacterium]MBL1205825.1 phosphatase PAP2 family protein [Calditrichota bacterium]NOG45652.1 phosphatase PAP2 family protein [Calditrichota bacterium]